MGTEILHQARFVLAHAAHDFGDRFINAGVHVRPFRGRVNGDMIRAEQDYLGNLAVALHIKQYFNLHNAREIQADPLNFFRYEFPNRVCDFHVAPRDRNGCVYVYLLHCRTSF